MGHAAACTVGPRSVPCQESRPPPPPHVGVLGGAGLVSGGTSTTNANTAWTRALKRPPLAAHERHGTHHHRSTGNGVYAGGLCIRNTKQSGPKIGAAGTE